MKGRFVLNTLKTCQIRRILANPDLHKLSRKNSKITNFFKFFKHLSQIPILERQIAQNCLKFYSKNFEILKFL